MEPAMRFELMTSSLPRRRSTPELRGRSAGRVDNLPLTSCNHNKLTTCSTVKTGAGDEIRTRDPQLGRLMLYQLSYTRSKSRMRAEGGGMKPSNFATLFIPHPSS